MVGYRTGPADSRQQCQMTIEEPMTSDAVQILMIDDDRADYLVTESLLNQFDGWQISLDWASTFEEGKVALEAGVHDLYLLDYMLDERTGLDMLREVGRAKLHSPVIMLTGKGNFKVDLEAMQLGVADYLNKTKLDVELAECTIRYALDRHESQRALEQSEARYRGIFDSLPIGLFRCTPEGGFMDANPALVRLLGYPDPEMLKGVYAPGFYFDPRDRKHFLEALELLGVVRAFETQLQRRDGRTLRLRTTARVHRDPSGQVAYVEGAVEDVTDTWPTVGFYSDAARFRRMFQAGPTGLIVVGVDGVIQDANPVFLRLSRYEVGELNQTRFADLWCDEDKASLLRDVGVLGAGGEDGLAGTRQLRDRRGDLILTRVTLALIRDWDDHPDHILVAIEPVVERRVGQP